MRLFQDDRDARRSIAQAARHCKLRFPVLNVQSANYWAATTNAEIPTNAWDVGFGSGSVGGTSKTISNLAWCVRGGHHDGSEY